MYYRIKANHFLHGNLVLSIYKLYCFSKLKTPRRVLEYIAIFSKNVMNEWLIWQIRVSSLLNYRKWCKLPTWKIDLWLYCCTGCGVRQAMVCKWHIVINWISPSSFSNNAYFCCCMYGSPINIKVHAFERKIRQNFCFIQNKLKRI